MIAKKLHLKPGMRVAVANAPSGFSLGKPAGVAIEKSLKRDLDLVLLFATTQNELNAQWPKALASVKQDGALWVSYPKRTQEFRRISAWASGTRRRDPTGIRSR